MNKIMVSISLEIFKVLINLIENAIHSISPKQINSILFNLKDIEKKAVEDYQKKLQENKLSNNGDELTNID